MLGKSNSRPRNKGVKMLKGTRVMMGREASEFVATVDKLRVLLH